MELVDIEKKMINICYNKPETMVRGWGRHLLEKKKGKSNGI